MKVFSIAGVIFNANNVNSIQKVNLTKEGDNKTVPGIQIVTNAGGVNFTYETLEERDKNFDTLMFNLKKL